MLLIINRDPRQSFDDELHLPFHLFIRHESFLERDSFAAVIQGRRHTSSDKTRAKARSFAGSFANSVNYFG
jgi:hypothetical protein